MRAGPVQQKRGRLAQRKSGCFTRSGSAVRSRHRPPFLSLPSHRARDHAARPYSASHGSPLPASETNCTIRQLSISLPLIECLIDGSRYTMPDALPAPAGAVAPARIAQASATPRPRPDRKTWRARDLAEPDRLLVKA